MLQNSVNLMVQPKFSPVICPLSFAFANKSLSFESLLSKVSLVSKVSKQCFVFAHYFHKTTNHPTVLYDKIPVFYTLKYFKFPTITFYPSA